MGPGATQRRRAILPASECFGQMHNSSVTPNIHSALLWYVLSLHAQTHTHIHAHTHNILYLTSPLPSLLCRSQTPTECSSGKERTEVTASEGDVPEDLDSTLVAEEVEEKEERSSASSSTFQEGTMAATPSCAAAPVKSQAAVSLSEVTPPSHGHEVSDARQEPDEVGSDVI